MTSIRIIAIAALAGTGDAFVSRPTSDHLYTFYVGFSYRLGRTGDAFVSRIVSRGRRL